MKVYVLLLLPSYTCVASLGHLLKALWQEPYKQNLFWKASNFFPFCSWLSSVLWMQMESLTQMLSTSTWQPGSAMTLWPTLPRRPTSARTAPSGSMTRQTTCQKHGWGVSSFSHLQSSSLTPCSLWVPQLLPSSTSSPWCCSGLPRASRRIVLHCSHRRSKHHCNCDTFSGFYHVEYWVTQQFKAIKI